ncbi:chemotaxis protein CheD [Leisingera sp. ANG-DT]|uniref:chemotaxis protein CheD n=1 Tax=Leisingera sp. ANG-DT TaxID=1577897 RepID=UPI0005801C41|nr:chemotaxis protein CheD [Leisingera sp. ANG-DT]KIC15661.1 chemotaxis protein CheD [Leisingera sp. ANG-DT]
MCVNDIQKIHVQIGQVKTGRAGQSLNAILGSCIGLGLLYPAKGIYGLAHCLLAKSPDSSDAICGRHVDQAVRSLQSLMEVSGKELRKLQAIVVGGANMTMPEDTDPARLVGSINARSAYRSLRDAGVRNIHEDVGGMQGRQVTIDCSSGEFTVKAIPRLGGQS